MLSSDLNDMQLACLAHKIAGKWEEFCFSARMEKCKIDCLERDYAKQAAVAAREALFIVRQLHKDLKLGDFLDLAKSAGIDITLR